MADSTRRGRSIRTFILNNLESHAENIASVTSRQFGISRQAANYHLRRLVNEGKIAAEGATRSKRYTLVKEVVLDAEIDLDQHREENEVWRKYVRPHLSDLRRNVLSIWHYGFTEMLNNVIDHSQGTSVRIGLHRSAIDYRMLIHDDGIGVFRKIREAFDLEDDAHAILELAKGKLTTDPDNHTGEGIFFCSRVFDWYSIQSGRALFIHQYGESIEYIAGGRSSQIAGTRVIMELQNSVSRTLNQVMSKFAAGEDYQFSKTVVPVRLAQYGDEMLISRSQAKRILTRLERFDAVVLDFSDVDSIGQAFADEIFRVFPKRHPEIQLVPAHMNTEVKRMVRRAQSGQ